MRIQAKFRCLGINSRWDGRHTVELAPVCDKEFPENKMFWEATPSGQAEVETGPDCPFEVGEFYLITFDRIQIEYSQIPEEELGHHYRLAHVMDMGGTIEVRLMSGWGYRTENHTRHAVDGIRNGTVTMNICNRQAWPHFQGQVEEGLWRVTYEKTSLQGS